MGRYAIKNIVCISVRIRRKHKSLLRINSGIRWSVTLQKRRILLDTPFLLTFYWQQTISRVLSWMVIYLGRLSPDASSRPFGRCRTDLASHSSVAPDGVYSARMSPYRRVSSYLAFPPLPAKAGGIFLLHFP